MFKETEQKKRYLTFIACLALLILGINLLFSRDASKVGETIIPEELQESTKKSSFENVVRKEAIKICVSGAVRNPGVYSVAKGTRVQEVFDTIVEVLPEANLSNVNLARICKDGMQIKVPLKKISKSIKTIKENDYEKININTASSSELVTLKGITPTIAKEIVRQRELYGPFVNKQELLKVKGIGKAKLAKIEELITW